MKQNPCVDIIGECQPYTVRAGILGTTPDHICYLLYISMQCELSCISCQYVRNTENKVSNIVLCTDIRTCVSDAG